jgi:2-dehydropantoate 2-reductase
MRHAVLGAGGIGGLLAAALTRAGGAVVLLMRPASIATYPGRVELDSFVLGSWGVDVPAAAALDHDVDVLWVATKATGLDESLAAAPAARVRDALVIPLLNGVDHLAALRQRYPRVAAASIRVESQRSSPGHIEQLGPLLRAEIAPPSIGFPTPAAARAATEEAVAALNDAGIATTVHEDEVSLLWGKLAFLAPIALATSALDAPLGEARQDPRLRGCQEEVLAVARHSGARLDDDAIRALVSGVPGQMRSSMQKDVAAGRTPELDAIAGPILRGGTRHGLPVPNTAELAAIVRDRRAILG